MAVECTITVISPGSLRRAPHLSKQPESFTALGRADLHQIAQRLAKIVQRRARGCRELRFTIPVARVRRLAVPVAPASQVRAIAPIAEQIALRLRDQPMLSPIRQAAPLRERHPARIFPVRGTDFASHSSPLARVVPSLAPPAGTALPLLARWTPPPASLQDAVLPLQGGRRRALSFARGVTAHADVTPRCHEQTKAPKKSEGRRSADRRVFLPAAAFRLRQRADRSALASRRSTAALASAVATTSGSAPGRVSPKPALRALPDRPRFEFSELLADRS